MSKGKKAEGENVDADNIDDDDADHSQCDGTDGENFDAFAREWHSSDGEDEHETDAGDAGDKGGGKDDDGEEEEEDDDDDDDDNYYEDEDDDEEDEEQSYSSSIITISGSEYDTDDHPLLDHAKEVYASESLSLFEHEYLKSRPLGPDFRGEDSKKTKYEVKRMENQGHSHKVSVSCYDAVTCCCKRFEVTGILCSHSLAALRSLHVEKIPDQYLLKWRMKSTNKSLMEESLSRKKRQCQISLDDCLSGKLGKGGIKTNASEEDSGTRSHWQDNNCAGSDHFGSPVLRHAKQIYVPEIYDLFREEYRKSEYLGTLVRHQECNWRGLVYEIEVFRYASNDMKKVYAEARDGTVKCSCRKFENSGILCSHALAVFGIICLARIPHQYIVPKFLKDPNVPVQLKIHGPNYDELLNFALNKVAEKRSTTLYSSLGMEMVKDRILEFLVALKDEKVQMLLNDMKEKGASGSGSGSGTQEMEFRGKAKFYDDQLLKNFTYKKSETMRKKLCILAHNIKMGAIWWRVNREDEDTDDGISDLGSDP